jgi:hypothetical protein
MPTDSAARGQDSEANRPSSTDGAWLFLREQPELVWHAFAPFALEH